jgi:hypothetical protein
LKSVNLQSLDTLTSFDVVSLFTNVPVDEALQFITLAEQSALQAKAFMDLLEVSLRTISFQADDKFFKQKDGMAMGSSLSPTSTSSILRNCLLI